MVLVIEEPEAHLHPLAQQWLARRLAQMAGDGLQLIITTHSAHFVDLLSLPGLVLVRKGDGHTTVVQRTVQQLVDTCVGSGAPPDRTTVDNILPFYAANAVPEILEGFFARGVVLVEGRTESLALPVLWRRLGFDHAKAGMAVIPVGGKGNIAKWKRLFEAYDIPAYIVFDNDLNDDRNGAKRLDALTAVMVPADRRNDLIRATDWIVDRRFCVFGRDFEQTLREFFPDYTRLEAEAHNEGVEAKPFVARWAAERLELDAGEGTTRLRRLMEAVIALTSPAVEVVAQEV